MPFVAICHSDASFQRGCNRLLPLLPHPITVEKPASDRLFIGGRQIYPSASGGTVL
jgi:hypothetical protein